MRPSADQTRIPLRFIFTVDTEADAGFTIETSMRTSPRLRNFRPGGQIPTSSGRRIGTAERELRKNPYRWPIDSGHGNRKALIKIRGSLDVPANCRETILAIPVGGVARRARSIPTLQKTHGGASDALAELPFSPRRAAAYHTPSCGMRSNRARPCASLVGGLAVVRLYAQRSSLIPFADKSRMRFDMRTIGIFDRRLSATSEKSRNNRLQLPNQS